MHINHNYSTRQIVTYVLGGSLNGLIHTVTKSIPLIQKYSNKVIEEFGLQPEKLEKYCRKNFPEKISFRDSLYLGPFDFIKPQENDDESGDSQDDAYDNDGNPKREDNDTLT